MNYFHNKSESFFREIREMFIYKSSDIKYIDNLNGLIPIYSKAICGYSVVPESFAYKMATKTQNANYLYELDCNFPLLDLSDESIYYGFNSLNKEEFAVVFITNTAQLLFGNDREPIKVEFIDNSKNDNSGNDEYTIAISGKSIIQPKFKSL